MKEALDLPLNRLVLEALYIIWGIELSNETYGPESNN